MRQYCRLVVVEDRRIRDRRHSHLEDRLVGHLEAGHHNHPEGRLEGRRLVGRRDREVGPGRRPKEYS